MFNKMKFEQVCVYISIMEVSQFTVYVQMKNLSNNVHYQPTSLQATIFKLL